MKNILITGALGYLGMEVIKKLKKDFDDKKINKIFALDIRNPEDIELPEYIDYFQSDIRDKAGLENIIIKNNIDVVVHLAAIIDSQGSSREFQHSVDVKGTENLLEACIAGSVKKIIISSSGAAYGYHKDNPSWLSENHPVRGNKIFAYSDHKRQVEEMLEMYRIKYPQLRQTIFRVCTILGKTTDNLITNLFKKKNILGIKGFESPYVFIWDQDVAACMRLAIFNNKDGIYNLAGDGAITNKNLALILNKKYLNIPSFLLKTGLSIGNKLKLTQYGPDQLLFLKYRPVLNNKKLKEEFGYTPEKTSLETFKYYLSANNIEYSHSEVDILNPD